MHQRIQHIIEVVSDAFDWAMDLPDNTQFPTEPASSGTLESAGVDISTAFIDALRILDSKLTSVNAHIQLHHQGRWIAAPDPRPDSPSDRKKRAKA